MTDYLPQRLRGLAHMSDDPHAQATCSEAADLIERQQRHIDRLTNDLTHAINEVGEYQRGER